MQNELRRREFYKLQVETKRKKPRGHQEAERWRDMVAEARKGLGKLQDLASSS